MKKNKKMKALSVRIPLDLAKKLELMAEKEHRSLNQQITYFLEKAIKERGE